MRRGVEGKGEERRDGKGVVERGGKREKEEKREGERK